MVIYKYNKNWGDINMTNGYYVKMYGKDCFLITLQDKRTTRLALNFINLVQNKLNRFVTISDSYVEYVKNQMMKATLERCTITKGDFSGLKYFKIVGNNFSMTSKPLDNPEEDVIIVGGEE